MYLYKTANRNDISYPLFHLYLLRQAFPESVMTQVNHGKMIGPEKSHDHQVRGKQNPFYLLVKKLTIFYLSFTVLNKI